MIGRSPSAEYLYRRERRRRRIRTAKRAIAWALLIAWLVLMFCVGWLACRAIFG